METKQSIKDLLKEALQKKELVKPNKTEERLSQEVESLCDFRPNCMINSGRVGGATGSSDDILL
jgi:hypothetical protein